jgi:hypothetical protein
MCKFWSAIISRSGKVYHLGEIVSHEKIIEQYKLKDGLMQNIARVEIPLLNGFELKPKEKRKLVIDEEEKPNWFTEKHEKNCFKELNAFMKNTFTKKWKRFKKLNARNEKLATMKGEEIIYREKLLPSHEKLIVKYYLLGEKQSWDSVWDSMWDSVRDSVRDSVWDSVRDSVWYSLWDSKKPYPLALPKNIFDLGYIHCLITEKDEVSRIYVYGKKGKLLKKIDFKDKKGKIIKGLV